MSVAVKVWASLLLLAVGAYGGYSLWRHSSYGPSRAWVGPPVADASAPSAPVSAQPFGELEFTERSGQKFQLQQLAGRVWAGSFFFSSCPYTCRQLNLAVAGLHKELADKDVTFVSFTVDPDNDTPAVLKAYADGFEADPQRWLFLTGQFRDTQRICNELFQLPLSGKQHTERIALMDREGKLRGTFNALDENTLKQFKKKLAEVLAERPADAQAVKE